ncbi:hypothetical protein GSY69_03705 [Brevibacterium sp. 5221]|uniref:RNA polymerase subunit sigma-70 n=1 Tax=Brevibacterium rongguiense TaxID=2695267 RepID=A0A6N9H4Z8_9MICO|nr:MULTISPECIES: SatD family protein [Brevibacterium]MYM19100.1 hypothetical protein [Brevibacterium rongguiense]WAL40661.1 SatD family protein [Brevibacterium sp. BRM-1]
MDSSQQVIAVILDIVGSRRLSDRAAAQAGIERALAASAAHAVPRTPPAPTVGDEFQAVYDELPTAILGCTLTALALPEGVELRVGYGVGTIRSVRSADDHGGAGIQDGPAWWNAREAIEQAHGRQSAGNPWVRSRLCAGDDGPLAGPAEAAVNAALTLADHCLTRMKRRERRVAAAALRGTPQREIAKQEGVSQSAVSQLLHRSGGAALRVALDLLADQAKAR